MSVFLLELIWRKISIGNPIFLLSALLIDWFHGVQGGRPVVQPGRGQLRLLLRSGGGGRSDLPPGHRDHLHRHQGAGQEQKDQAAARPPW